MAKTKKELICGCVLALDYDGSLGIVFCPKHRAAHVLYRALKDLVDWLNDDAHMVGQILRIKANTQKALAKAESK